MPSSSLETVSAEHEFATHIDVEPHGPPTKRRFAPDITKSAVLHGDLSGAVLDQ